MLGQAWDVANEPNSFAVPTLVKFCSAAAFYYDENYVEFKGQIDEALNKIPKDGRPVIVLPKIGRGCSRMFELAPRLYLYLTQRLSEIEYKNITWRYNQ